MTSARALCPRRNRHALRNCLRTPSGALKRLAFWLTLERQLMMRPSKRLGRHHRLRWRQRSALMRQVLEGQPSQEVFRPAPSGWWFWRAMRWGGPGLLLGWLLARL